MGGMIRSSRQARRAIVALCAAITVAQGQPRRVVRGVVTDTADRPVRSVNIQLAGAASVVTDDSGRFRLEIPHQNRVTFDVLRLGFMPSRFGLRAGGDTTVTITIFPVAQLLATVEVTAPEVEHALQRSGFAQRRDERLHGTNSGIFVVAADIEKRNPPHLTQMFDDLPGVAFCRTKNGGVCGMFGSHLIPDPYSSTYRLVPCPITIYLDGSRLNAAERATTAVDIDVLVTPSSVAGFEYYPSGNRIPNQYQLMNGSCGLVLIWTKRG